MRSGVRVLIAAAVAAAVVAVLPLAVRWDLGGGVGSRSSLVVGTATTPGAPLTVGGVQGAAAVATPVANLTDSKLGSPILTQVQMKPGDTSSSTVTITADASVVVTVFESGVTHSGPAGSGNLAHELTLTVTDQTANKTVYSGPFDSMPASTQVCSIHSTATSCLAWAVNESHAFLFTVTFPQAGGLTPPALPTRPAATSNPDNTFQNTNASTTIVWGASGQSTSCDGGIHKGNNLEIPSGVICILVDYSQPGNITVDAGGTLEVFGGSTHGNVQSNGGTVTIGPDSSGVLASVTGNVQAQGGGSISVTGASITGNLQITSTGARGVTQLVCASTINGNLQAQSLTGTLVIGDRSQCASANQVGGNLQIQSNNGPPPTPSVIVSYNVIQKNFQCSGDTPPATGVAGSNQVHGSIQAGECAPLATKV